MTTTLDDRIGREPSDQPPRVLLRVLGQLSVAADGIEIHVAGTHRRRLLALLASRAGRTVSIDAIAEGVWDDDIPPSATKTIQAHVMRLRRSLGAAGDLITTVPNGYRLDVADDVVDATRFEALVAEGRRAAGRGDARSAVEHFSSALSLWRGPAYVEFPDAAFAAAERVRLDEVRLAAIEDRAEADLELGNVAVTVAHLEQLVAEEPGRERAWCLLMRALYAAGRQHEALQVYDRARRALAEHFGLDPGPELRRLERRILDQDPALYVAGDRSLLPAPLRTSTPLIGRADDVERLREAWRTARRGTGKVVVLAGAIDVGRTRLAAELAGEVVDDNGWVEYIRGTEGFESTLGSGAMGAPGVAVDAITDRCRRGPLLLVVDDAERLPAVSLPAIDAIMSAAERLSLLVLLVVDPAAGGPIVELVRRLAVATTHELAPLPDDDIRRIVAADGVDPDAVAVTVAVAAGLPGVARREAAAWAERIAGDRLQAAATSSLDATVDAERARATVHDEVLALVAARARRDELLSESWVGRQPFRALAYYGPEDADLFVGRERLTAELAARVLDRRLVAVVGPSGGGKSSLVRAGLVPLVRSGRLPGGEPWRCTVIVPGHDPLDALDRAAELDEPGAQLLVVDQFEELFASDDANDFATRLVDLVLDAALDVHVVIVVRADQYAALGATRTLRDLVEDATILVGPPTDDELRRIVEVPARRTGCVVEPPLVDAILRDVGGHHAALPLLSAALADAWEHRRADTLTLERYLQAGGLACAVDRLGRRALEHADADEIRRVMLRLVDVTDDGRWVRRRVAMDDIPSDLHRALDALVDARIVQSGGDVEVVHEVVFTAWPQLVAWLEDARADLVTERWLRIAATAWDDGGRSDDDVPRGARLAAAHDFVSRHVDAAPLIVELVDAGRAMAAVEQERAEAQRVRDARARRRLTGALAIAAVLLVVALVGATVAVRNGHQAENERSNAVAAATAASIARLVAESERELDSHLDLALLLAVEAYDHAQTPETAGALLTAVTDNQTAEHSLPGAALGHPGQLVRTNSSFLGFIAGAPPIGTDVAVSADGRIVISTGWTGTDDDGLSIVFNTSTREEIARIETAAEADQVDVSADGAYALVRDWTGSVHVMDTASGTVSTLPPDVTGYIKRAYFVDGDRIAALTTGGDVLVWDHTAGAGPDVVAVGEGFGSREDFVGIAPDGTMIFTEGAQSIVFRNVDDGAAVRRVDLELAADTDFRRFAVSADGTWVAGMVYEGRLYAWNGRTGELVGDAAARPGTIRAIEFSPTSPSVLAIASTGGGISLYDVATDRQIGEPLRGHGSGPRDVAFSASGDYLVSIADDGLIALWGRNDAGGPIGRRDEGAAALFDPRFDPKQPNWAIPHVDAPTRVPRPDGTMLELDDRFHGLGADFSPDGERMVGVNFQLTHLRMWALETGARLGDAVAPAYYSSIIPRFSPDGTFVDVAADYRIVRYDGHDLTEVASVDSPFSVQGPVAHVPGTNEVIGAGLGGYVGRFDLATGEVVALGRSRDASNLDGAVLSPDGTIVATYHPYSFRVALFDAATLRPIGKPFLAGDLGFLPRFTDDGQLAGYGLFNEPTLWTVNPDDWRAAACDLAGRNLTHDEWAEYLGDEQYRATCVEWDPAN